MKKERLNPRSKELLREMMGMYQPKTVGDIQAMLKDLFADTMEDMLKAELDEELGYAKNSQQPKTTGNRRNGSYPKTVQSNIGEIEVNIPRDRDGEYEPELIPKGTRDVSGLEEKVLSLWSCQYVCVVLSDCVVRAFQMFRNSIDRPTVLQTDFDFMLLFT
jgi:hypothetical protein